MSNKPMIQLEAKDGHDAPWVPVGEPKPAPVPNEHLDRAIDAGENATDITWRGDVRAFSRALVAELLRDMDEPPLDPPAILGWDLAIKVIKRRAGLEGEG